MPEKVVIIGGGVAGTNLAKKLVDKNRGFEITLVKKETHASYSPCGIPDVLSGKISGMESILKDSLDNYLTKRGGTIKSGVRVTKLNINSKTVETDVGETLGFDVLVIATGRRPAIPKLNGIGLKGVYSLCDLEDSLRLYDALREAERAVIIGAGPIGLECATAFRDQGIKTSLVEAKSHLLPGLLDEDMAGLVEAKLKAQGVNIFTSEQVTEINGKDAVESVRVNDSEIRADLVLVATGIWPNSELAKEAGIEVGVNNGILVDSRHRVIKDSQALADVYALGDCVEVKNRITGTYQLSPIVSTAVLASRIIAENICGEDICLDSYLSPYIMVAGGLEIGAVGIISHQAEQIGANIVIGKGSGHTKVNYYPEAKKMTVKLLSDREYLLGAQIVGGEDVKERINAITGLIHLKVKVQDILQMERCFTPSLCTSRDAFQRAVEELLGVLA
ncbi:MAG: FAD-dependent oxidoreductase [bacterium]